MTSTPPPTEPDWAPLAACLADIPAGMSLSLAARHLASGSTLDHDPTRPIQAASTIKVLILAALARAVDAGRIDLDMEKCVDPLMRVGGSGVLNWLHESITLPLRDHAWLMIAISDNTASNAVIDAVGVSEVNATAAELNVSSLELARPFLGYLPKGETNRNQVTAQGLTDLLTAIWTDTAASDEMCAWMRKLHEDQQHRDRLARMLPEAVAYAGKTGTLNGISHDCGVITGPTGSIVMSALIESDVNKYEDDMFLGKIGQAVAQIVS